jgi:hypothetical protein
VKEEKGEVVSYISASSSLPYILSSFLSFLSLPPGFLPPQQGRTTEEDEAIKNTSMILQLIDT